MYFVTLFGTFCIVALYLTLHYTSTSFFLFEWYLRANSTTGLGMDDVHMYHNNYTHINNVGLAWACFKNIPTSQ